MRHHDVRDAWHSFMAATSLPSGTSFVDQVSLEMMTREAIETAFVLDADFAAAGVQVIP